MPTGRKIESKYGYKQVLGELTVNKVTYGHTKLSVEIASRLQVTCSQTGVKPIFSIGSSDGGPGKLMSSSVAEMFSSLLTSRKSSISML